MSDPLANPVQDFFIDVRTTNSLRRAHLETVGDVVNQTSADLLDIPNFGATSLRHVEVTLAYNGLQLRDGTCPTCGADRKHQRRTPA